MRSRSRGNIIRDLVRNGMDRREAESHFGFLLDGGVWLPTPTADDHYEKVAARKIGERRKSAPSTDGHRGISGRFYVRNPFGKGDYAVACFDSEQHYRRLSPPKYISEEKMMGDLETVDYYEFTVHVNGEGKTYYTDICGEIIGDGSPMEEMIDLLWEIHGRENVKFDYRKCITTNLESLA